MAQETKKVEIRFGKREFALVAIAVIALALIAYSNFVSDPNQNIFYNTWNSIYNYFNPNTSNSSLEFHYATAFNMTWAFRADLREAEKVKAYPTDDAIYLELFSIGDSPFVKNITVAFKDAGQQENIYYQLQILELVSKLKKTYELRYGGESPGFNAIAVDSYYKLPGKIQNPIIALIHPVFANETSIRLENHVITLSAKTHGDMDLVATKLLMIALQLKRTD